MSYLIGLTTAVKNTSIAMTVSNVFAEGEDTVIECVYTVNGELRKFSANEETFIGFGDELLYRDGAFVEAYNTLSESDDEDDEEEEEEEDGPKGPTLPDHSDLRN